MLSNTSDVDNGKGLPVTLFISSDNEAGEMVGEMSIQYRYQTDIYKAKYSVNGLIDYENKSIYIEQVKLIYYDLLPRGLQWCFGNGTFQIFRNPYKKKNYLDGYMTTSCGPEKLRMVLIKNKFSKFSAFLFRIKKDGYIYIHTPFLCSNHSKISF